MKLSAVEKNVILMNAKTIILLSLLLIPAFSQILPAAKNTDIMLSDNKLALVFNSQTYSLISIVNSQSGCEFLDREKPAAPLWQIYFLVNGQVKSINANNAQYNTVIHKFSEDRRSLSIYWQGVNLGFSPGTVDITAEIKLNTAKHVLSDWTINITNKSNASIYEVRYPQINNIQPPGENDLFLHSAYSNYIACHPSKMQTYLNHEFYYPGTAMMQFFGYYGDSGGLYIATHDPNGFEKKFDFSYDKKTDRIDYHLSNYAENPHGQPRNYTQSYPAIIGVFSGDWVDATLIYKEWAVKQSWTKKGPVHKRKDIPEWFCNTPVLFMLNGPPRERASQLIEWRKYLGSPIAVQWYETQLAGHDERYPELFPTHLDTEKIIPQLKKHDIHVFPYANGHFWDPLFTQSWHDKQAEKGTIKTHDGKPICWMYFSTLATAMCPSSKVYQDWQIDTSVTGIKDYGFDGYYYDQVTIVHGARLRCYDPNHNHNNKGGGYQNGFYADGWRKIINEVQQKCGGSFFSSSEYPQEQFIDILSSFYVYCGIDALPVWSAVYGRFSSSHCPTHKHNIDFLKLEKEGFRSGIARAYVNGIRYQNSTYWGNYPSDQLEHAAFVRETVRSWQAGAKYFLYGGDWLRPFKIQVTPNDRPEKEVFSSIWRHRDNPRVTGIILANISDEEKIVTCEINRAAYDIPTSAKLHALYLPNGKLLSPDLCKVSLAPRTINVLQYSEDIPATVQNPKSDMMVNNKSPIQQHQAVITMSGEPNPSFSNSAMILWLKADNGQKKISEKKTVWIDQSMSGRNGQQLGEQVPAINKDMGLDFNNHAVFECDGSGKQSFWVSKLFEDCTELTVFVVARPQSNIPGALVGGHSPDDVLLSTSSWNVGKNPKERISIPLEAEKVNIYSTWWKNGERTGCNITGQGKDFNKEVTNGIITGKTPFYSLAHGWIGGCCDGGKVLPFKGQIAEIIVYNKLLSPEERNAIGYYLQKKYALKGSFGKPDIKALGSPGYLTSKRQEPITHIKYWARKDRGARSMFGERLPEGNYQYSNVDWLQNPGGDEVDIFVKKPSRYLWSCNGTSIINDVKGEENFLTVRVPAQEPYANNPPLQIIYRTQYNIEGKENVSARIVKATEECLQVYIRATGTQFILSGLSGGHVVMTQTGKNIFAGVVKESVTLQVVAGEEYFLSYSKAMNGTLPILISQQSRGPWLAPLITEKVQFDILNESSQTVIIEKINLQTNKDIDSSICLKPLNIPTGFKLAPGEKTIGSYAVTAINSDLLGRIIKVAIKASCRENDGLKEVVSDDIKFRVARPIRADIPLPASGKSRDIDLAPGKDSNFNLTVNNICPYTMEYRVYVDKSKALEISVSPLEYSWRKLPGFVWDACVYAQPDLSRLSLNSLNFKVSAPANVKEGGEITVYVEYRASPDTPSHSVNLIMQKINVNIVREKNTASGTEDKPEMIF